MKGKIATIMVALVTIAVLFPTLAFSQEIPREKPGACWVNFKEGSWVKYKMRMGEMEAVIKKTLKSKTAEEVVVVTETEIPGMPSSSVEEHLSLKPKEEEGQIKVIKTSEEDITLAGKKFRCKVIEYEDVKEKYTAKIWLSDEVPFLFDRGVVKASQQDEGEKEAKVVWEYAGEKEFTVGDKKVKCTIFTIFKGEIDEEGDKEYWVSKEVPGMQVKLGELLELIDFEIK
ncbi:MAG: hypothetical protein NUW13_10720 [candidate division KSB1 bacterium]|nr:hypothetical protein [candidate division KSB1 bacterium]